MKNNEEELRTASHNDSAENQESVDKINPNEDNMTGEAAAMETVGNETEKLKEEIKMLNDRFLRLYSEFENYKKRSGRERTEYLKTAGSETIISLLPILDDFERAIKTMADAGKSDAISEGVSLIFSKFKTVLTQKGLQEMRSSGEVFDSEIHDAVTTAPAPVEEMKGKVLEELEKGYFLNGKVIRYAKVIVGN